MKKLIFLHFLIATCIYFFSVVLWNHELPLTYDFHNYMLQSMDDEFRDIVGVRSVELKVGGTGGHKSLTLDSLEKEKRWMEGLLAQRKKRGGIEGLMVQKREGEIKGFGNYWQERGRK
ncbi:hypothetical protein Ahy_B04g071085 isoform A [Arachis hypogaea]|uniref:Uncharacterized protein n=1 Tax=Arachis hypogaea TaxID=3818 RepID=A0A444ZK11_ARAHY|nr:hypothetical protein Ahy_B04g071085 isoform A [Arachis hypogaea]